MKVSILIHYGEQSMTDPDEIMMEGWGIQATDILQVTSGLINTSFVVKDISNSYLLQSVNLKVLSNTASIISNWQKAAKLLASSRYKGDLVDFITTKKGKYFYKKRWRLQKFLAHDFQCDVIHDVEKLYVASSSYGAFDVGLNRLKTEYSTVIPDFHSPRRRLENLETLEKSSSLLRLKKSKQILEAIWKIGNNLKAFKFPHRGVHGDPKPSNLLFQNDRDQATVIDWDTIQQGFYCYDFGDMVRSMLTTVPENSERYDDIEFQKERYTYLCHGYKEYIHDLSIPEELQSMTYGIIPIILEQAVRFLSDYLSGGKYYQSSYEDENLVRTMNQMKLVQCISENQEYVQEIWRKA